MRSLLRFNYFLTVFVFISVIYHSDALSAYKGRTNGFGISIVKASTGFSPTFVNDTNGVRTIGYGHSCKAKDSCAHVVTPLSQEAAALLLNQDMRTAESCVTTNVKYPKLNEAQFSALASFTQSVGCSNFRSSNLLKLLNKGDPKNAAREFLRYATIGVTSSRSLTRRREQEKNLFCSKGGC